VEDDTTCTVRLGSGLELQDVRLRAVVNDKKPGILVKPTVGSHVLVADFSGGQLTDMAVLQYSEVDSITLNGGDLKGLIRIEDLTDKLNDLVLKVNDLTQTFNGHTHTCNLSVSTTGTAVAQTGTATGSSQGPSQTAQQAEQFNKADYEDTSVTH
ncbi:MAG: hypothetical protein IJT12_04015, partial [Paludibacteraceae bacterium]|nr:hypothetical protein [Paludibacteraceae bacterium]